MEKGKNLTGEQYKILKNKGTELPFTSKLLKEKRNGNYYCADCNSMLFDSKTKFDSKTGWPSFTDVVTNNIELKPDNSLFMNRIEVVCKKCKGHLGHVFDDGPNGKKRYCINGCVLNFEEKK